MSSCEAILGRCGIHSMKNISILAMKMISGKLLKNFIFFLWMVAGFVLAGIALTVANMNSFDEMQFHKICDVQRTGYLFVEESEKYEDEVAFFEGIGLAPEVEKVGEFVNLGGELGEELAKIQMGHQYTNLYGGADMVECTCIDKDVFDIFHINLSLRENLGTYQNEIILGHQYQKKYQNTDSIKLEDTEYKILGFIDKNEKWLSEDVAYSDIPEITSFVNTDYMVFVPVMPEEKSQCTNTSYYKLAKGVTQAQFEKTVQKIAEKNKVKVSVHALDEYIETVKEKNETMLKALVKYSLYLLGAVLFIICVLKVYSLFGNKRQYGVLYTSGLTSRQIVTLICLENCFMFAFALVAAFLLLWNFVTLCQNTGYLLRGEVINGVIREILYSRVFVQEFLLCVIMTVISSVIPSVVFCKISPLSMMRDYNE